VHFDDERDQAVVREIGESHDSVGLMKRLVVREADKFQERTDQAEFCIGDGQKQLVTNRLAFGTGPLAGLDDLQLWN
jgi:hypothetical protein